MDIDLQLFFIISTGISIPSQFLYTTVVSECLFASFVVYPSSKLTTGILIMYLFHIEIMYIHLLLSASTCKLKPYNDYKHVYSTWSLINANS